MDGEGMGFCSVFTVLESPLMLFRQHKTCLLAVRIELYLE